MCVCVCVCVCMCVYRRFSFIMLAAAAAAATTGSRSRSRSNNSPRPVLPVADTMRHESSQQSSWPRYMGDSGVWASDTLIDSPTVSDAESDVEVVGDARVAQPVFSLYSDAVNSTLVDLTVVASQPPLAAVDPHSTSSPIEEPSEISPPQLVMACPPLVHPQVAPMSAQRDLGPAPGEAAFRIDIRSQSLRWWWLIRVERTGVGGLDHSKLTAWIRMGFPADQHCRSLPSGGCGRASPEYNVVADEPKERELWISWGAVLWWSLLTAEKERLASHGLDSRMCLARFQREIDLQVPPSPFSLPVWLAEGVMWKHAPHQASVAESA
jgi:hypothetical protein